MVWSVHFSISLERLGDVILKGRPSRWFSFQPRNSQGEQSRRPTLPRLQGSRDSIISPWLFTAVRVGQGRTMEDLSGVPSTEDETSAPVSLTTKGQTLESPEAGRAEKK